MTWTLKDRSPQQHEPGDHNSRTSFPRKETLRDWHLDVELFRLLHLPVHGSGHLR